MPCRLNFHNRFAREGEIGEETLVHGTVIPEQSMISQSSPVGPFIMPLGASAACRVRVAFYPAVVNQASG